MSALTMGLAEAKNNFSRVTAEVNRTGKPVTILKNNRPWLYALRERCLAVVIVFRMIGCFAFIYDQLGVERKIRAHLEMLL